MPHPNIPQFEYNQITENIFIGTNQCCTTHFEKELLKKGITADISLEAERVDLPYGVEFYAWIPIADNTAPAEEKFLLFNCIINELVLQDKKIYIHCKNGHGRAPTMVAGYFISKGDTPEEAIKIIKEKRPSIHPHAIQIRALEQLYRNLKSL